mgnify:CR=1 FL=1
MNISRHNETLTIETNGRTVVHKLKRTGPGKLPTFRLGGKLYEYEHDVYGDLL